MYHNYKAVLKFLWGKKTVSHKRGQKHGLPDTYKNKDYANGYEDYIKFDT